jgi:hypothetical protein
MAIEIRNDCHWSPLLIISPFPLIACYFHVQVMSDEHGVDPTGEERDGERMPRRNRTPVNPNN